jgi:hypothetical protein
VNLNANQELVEQMKHGSNTATNALAGLGLKVKQNDDVGDDFDDSDAEGGSEDGEMA